MCWTELIPPGNWKRRLVHTQLTIFLLLLHPIMPSIFAPQQSDIVPVPALGHSQLATPASEAQIHTDTSHTNTSQRTELEVCSALPATHLALIWCLLFAPQTTFFKVTLWCGLIIRETKPGLPSPTLLSFDKWIEAHLTHAWEWNTLR